MPWTTPATLSARDRISAAFWNTQVRDNMVELAPYFAAWTTWTPTISQNGTRTSTVNSARYIKIGRNVRAIVSVNITQAGTSGNLIICSIPTGTPVAIGETAIGMFTYSRTTGTRYAGTAALYSGNQVIFQVSGTGNAMGADPAFATANGDYLSINFSYETTS